MRIRITKIKEDKGTDKKNDIKVQSSINKWGN